MKKHFGSLLTMATVFGMVCAATISAQEKKEPSSNAGQLGEVEVTDQARDKVDIEKVTPDVEIEIRDIVDSVTDKTEALLEQGKPIPSPEDFEQFDRLASQQTARPYLPDLSEPPLISFYPSISQTTVKSWRLEVTDAQGNIIYTVKGRGNPVDRIVWDGRDERGDIMRVGKYYSYRFITIDEFK
ncbi:MAG: hypothetical protein GF384_09210, partial [Elusimicrobia bacterium]|nr:hypothetical protein [Elusimicrobiota bacterium]MBD3412762.1 hypothetical protein [Elusimicrobiota bacterium]